MKGIWRRRPGRRTVAAAVATAIAATGITWAGLGGGEESHHDASPPRPVVKEVTTAVAMNRAVRTGKPVEITELRTPSSSTFARPDRLLERRQYVSPIRAKVDGSWKPIDTTLRRTDAGWEPAATNTHMVFSAGTAHTAGRDARASRVVQRVSLVRGAPARAGDTPSPLASLDVGEGIVQLTWPGPIPTPVVDGSRILYPEILPGADLVLTADDGGFAQLLVVKNRQAAADPRVAQLTYGLTSPTLLFRVDPLSDIVSAENKNGDEVALSPSPLMWDSSGQPAVTDGQVGASAQPTAPEAPPTSTPSTEPEPTTTATTDVDVESDEQTDAESEVLPTASEEPAPTVSEPTLPPVPTEPTPAPSQSGSAATLALPSLDGPGPDTRGALVEADLAADQWTLTPDPDFLTDPATVYPVFIDPSVTKHTQNWTTAYSRHPQATFYNGRNFNKGGTHEARVGFESDSWGTSRSFFTVDFDPSLRGTVISSAKLRLLETYSWSCSARQMTVHLSGKISSKTNWKNAPKLHDGNQIAARSFAHGYKSGCRDAYETFDVKKTAQQAADGSWNSITFGLRAGNEKSQYAWKKFQANGENGPVLVLVYNRKPTPPTNLDLGPEAKCTTTPPYVRMGSGTVYFTAKATDKDSNLKELDFDLWPTGQWDTTKDLLKGAGTVSVGGSTSEALRTTPAFSTTNLTNNTLYSWRVRAVDAANATSSYSPANTPCRFVLDTAAPKPPKVRSDVFPNADIKENGFANDAEDSVWSTVKFGSPGTFHLRALNSDVVKYEYSFNTASYNFSKARTAGTSPSVETAVTDLKPPTAGPNVLFVRTVDQAGNVSEATKYFFYVTPRDEADTPGDFTGDKLPDLMVVTEGGNLALYPSLGQTADITKPSGKLGYSMSGAYRGNPDKDPNGDTLPAYVAAPNGHFKNNPLIAHNGDIYGADGLQDLVVRLGDRLWVYPGDGYGAVNVDERREILLPANAPNPSTFTQIMSAGDMTGDGRADFLVTAGDVLWAFTGYHGATVQQAQQIASTPWNTQDIVTVLDVDGDAVTDLVFRQDSGRLLLRKGKPAGSGVAFSSLATAAASKDGIDTVYGSAGWSSTSIPRLIGTPDVTGDGIPDVWTVPANGSVRLYAGARNVLPGGGTEIMTPRDYWRTRLAIG
ncbi:DNRLRE domain-containing protein [Streptomyces sp. NPDC088707]|uniref:DNRLRE domain-containing protein n=1 Tax=Streptomyces sp. NPDC088707 TaxID=3365871 RepID=UPI0037FDA505